MNRAWSSMRGFLQNGEPCALLTVTATQGSAPRAAGTRMVVTESICVGTIGGGQLEYSAVENARALLREPPNEGTRTLHSYTLGPELRQCCGGVVELTIDLLNRSDLEWIEAAETMQAQAPCVLVGRAPATDEPVKSKRRVLGASAQWGFEDNPADELLIEGGRALLDAVHETRGTQQAVNRIEIDDTAWILEQLVGPAFTLYLFGAGHVGKALVEVLTGYPCRIVWVDNRAAEFPAKVPVNVETRVSGDPVDIVIDAPPGSYFLVMTHSHPLDLALCKAILARPFAYLGLIGSKSKRARFQKQLRIAGADPAQLARLTCPIGIDSIRGKHPAAIAVAVAAQLIELSERYDAQAPAMIEAAGRVGA